MLTAKKERATMSKDREKEDAYDSGASEGLSFRHDNKDMTQKPSDEVMESERVHIMDRVNEFDTIEEQEQFLRGFNSGMQGGDNNE